MSLMCCTITLIATGGRKHTLRASLKGIFERTFILRASGNYDVGIFFSLKKTEDKRVYKIHYVTCMQVYTYLSMCAVCVSVVSLCISYVFDTVSCVYW